MIDAADPPPGVSVVMANYNGERYLEAAATSALRQTRRDLELLIVDDASTDGSLAAARELASRDGRVRVIRQPVNGGPAAARNRGLAEARGAWIAVHDSDDLVHPCRIERLLAEAEASGADIMVDDMVVFYENAERAPHRFLKSWKGPEKSWISAETFINSGTMFGGLSLGPLKPLFRASSLRALGLAYDERLQIGEDFDLVARALLAGLTMRLDVPPHYFYRKHAASISHRMRADQIRAMQAAAAGLPTTDGSKALGRAMARYRASLKAALAFEQFVEAWKAGRFAPALQELLREPRAAPFLALPLAARLRRMGRRLAGGPGARVAATLAQSP